MSIDLDVLDACAGRPVPNVALEPFDRFGVAFGHDLHAAVGEIPHPAVQAFAARCVFGEKPEADALNAPADRVASRDAHAEARMIACVILDETERLAWLTNPSTPTLKRLLLGKPIPSSLAHHERLSRVTGLAVLSSDALSSVAYATEFILVTLVVAGVAALGYAIPISLVIATLLAIVAFSYRQTIHAYPTGGGAYIVAKENIGANAGLIAAASLLVDYTLTVVGQHRGRRARDHVGVSARSTSYRVELCLGVSRDPDGRQPARHPRVGTASSRCRPISSSFSIFVLIVAGALPLRHRRHRAGRPCRCRRTPAHAAADDVSPADRVRQRLHGDDRRRGGLERRAGVPAAGSEERVGDAGRDGGARDHDVRRHHVPGARVPA